MNWTRIFEQISKIQVKSIAETPLKYGLFLAILATFSACFSAPTWVSVLLFILTILLFIIGLSSYCYFSVKNPDYLRSESFQIKKQSIELLGDSENKFNPHLKGIVSIASPYSKELKEGDEDNNNQLDDNV